MTENRRGNLIKKEWKDRILVNVVDEIIASQKHHLWSGALVITENPKIKPIAYESQAQMSPNGYFRTFTFMCS